MPGEANLHTHIKAQLDAMSHDDMVAMLERDPLVQAVLAAAPERDRERIRGFVVDFLRGWKVGAVDPIVAMASNPDFVRAFVKAVASRDPGAGGLGDLI